MSECYQVCRPDCRVGSLGEERNLSETLGSLAMPHKGTLRGGKGQFCQEQYAELAHNPHEWQIPLLEGKCSWVCAKGGICHSRGYTGHQVET